MSDDLLNETAIEILDDMASLEGRELKGFRKTITSELGELLRASNPTLKLSNNPALTILLVTNLYSSDPCSSCSENLANVTNWVNDNQLFNNSVRVILLDAVNGIPDKKIFQKLKIDFNDVPITYFFNETFGLIDVVQGIMSTDYLETFWSPHFE